MGRRKKSEIEAEQKSFIDEVTEPEAHEIEEPAQEKKVDVAYSGTYTVTAKLLNLRKDAGKGNGVVVVMPKGTRVVCSGDSKVADGDTWLLVSVSIKGNLYEGYCMLSFLNK